MANQKIKACVATKEHIYTELIQQKEAISIGLLIAIKVKGQNNVR